jgi:2-polyprenyl-3-methyl-5-hydroxy-6-metoxy-1,4-benzoquinol methylase
MNPASNYDDTYFAFQSGMGNFGGWAELSKFAPHIRNEDTILDFGCGGGYLLHNLKNTAKAGVEINPAARRVCEQLGLTVYAEKSEIPDGHFDIIISNHALEHCASPFDEILGLKSKLKPGGRMLANRL